MFRRLLLALLGFAAGSMPAVAAGLWVYDNALQNGFQDWSWATRNLAATGTVHSAPNAIEVVFFAMRRSYQNLVIPQLAALTLPTRSSGLHVYNRSR